MTRGAYIPDRNGSDALNATFAGLDFPDARAHDQLALHLLFSPHAAASISRSRPAGPNRPRLICVLLVNSDTLTANYSVK